MDPYHRRPNHPQDSNGQAVGPNKPALITDPEDFELADCEAVHYRTWGELIGEALGKPGGR